MNAVETTQKLQAQIDAIQERHKQERTHKIDADEKDDEQAMNDTNERDKATQAKCGDERAYPTPASEGTPVD